MGAEGLWGAHWKVCRGGCRGAMGAQSEQARKWDGPLELAVVLKCRVLGPWVALLASVSSFEKCAPLT